MFSWRHKLQIFKSIVRAYTIDVMDMFFSEKSTPKMLLHNKPMQFFHLAINCLFPISIMQRRARCPEQCGRVAMPPPSVVMNAAPSPIFYRLFTQRAFIHCSLIILFTVSACHTKPVPKAVEVKATSKGCSRAFVEEHHNLLAENIRLKEALRNCQARHN